MTDDIHSARWRKLRKAVLQRETVCYLCGQPVDKGLPSNSPMGAEVDHVAPRAHGGAVYDESNLHLVHRRCNSQKGASPLEVFRFKQGAEQHTSRDW